MVVNPQIKLSYEDYQNLPESETKRYELLEGELVMVPAPNWFHQSIARVLFKFLDNFVGKNSLGEVRFAPLDVVLSDEIVVQPDIIYISKQRAKIIHQEEVRGAPDLVVEILSLATAKRDRTTKKTLYARYGVTEYWLVDPETNTVEVLKLTARGYRRAGVYGEKETLRSPLLPGLEIPLSKVF